MPTVFLIHACRHIETVQLPHRRTPEERQRQREEAEKVDCPLCRGEEHWWMKIGFSHEA